MRLYELTDQYRLVMERIENAEGELDEGLEALLDEAEGEFDQKVENTVKVLKNLKAEEEVVRAEAQRFQSRAQALSRKQEWLREYLLYNMQKAKRQKVDGDLFKVKVGQSPWRVQVDNLSEVPEEYKRVKEEVDKKAVAEVLKEGETIAGVRFVRKPTITIR